MAISKQMKFRILKLCSFMESLPRAADKHFDMRTFWLDQSLGHDHPLPKKVTDILRSCGTTACALGWAATMPYFQKLGCRFNKNGYLVGLSVVVVEESDKWPALFGGRNEDKTPKQWARRARALVREWEAK